MQYFIDLWEKEGEFFDIEGVSFRHAELSRLLHFEGLAACINDNIIDCISNLMNNQEGDFWTMPSHAYGEYIREDLGIGQVGGRLMKKWTKKMGKGHVPRYLMVPFAVAMHYRVIIWDTHRDREVYLDPLNPIAGEAEQSWIPYSV